MKHLHDIDELLHEPLLGAAEGDGDDQHHNDHQTQKQQRSARPMAVVEQLMLSPYEKWLAHGRFPYKIVLHILLIALTCAQMGIYDAQNAAYMRATHRNWAYFFLPPGSTIGIVPRYQRELFTINETLEALAFMREAYFSVGNASVANYEYLLTAEGEVAPMEMQVTRRLQPSGRVETKSYNVTQDPDSSIGPFDPGMPPKQQKHLLRSLHKVRFSFFLKDLQYGNYYQECFRWYVHVSFSTVENAQLKAEVDESQVARCSSRSFWSAIKQRFVWLHGVIALVTLVYLALSGKALLRSYKMINRAQELLNEHVQRESQYSNKTRRSTKLDINKSGDDTASASTLEQQQQRRRVDKLQKEVFGSWSTIPFVLKLKLFNGLQLVVFTSLTLLLTSSIWSLFFLKAHVPIHFWHRLLHATAVLLLWSCLVGYLEHNSHVYSIVLTLKWGAPRVLQFLIGVSPIFLGYALFGTIYFGTRIKEFGSMSASMATLFAVMNGDVILDTFDAFDLHHFGLSGKIYLYSFISLFIYVVLNIFVAIVEEAFFATRSCRRMLSVLLSDPEFATAKVAQETEISAEMVRVLLRAVDTDEE